MRAPDGSQGTTNMTTGNTSLLRYLALRTAAFVMLTTASTGFMALPYLA